MVDGLLLEVVELERVFERHVGHKLVKVHQVLLDVDDVGPFLLLERLAPPFGLLSGRIRERERLGPGKR
jgi:hypothetical protein